MYRMGRLAVGIALCLTACQSKDAAISTPPVEGSSIRIAVEGDYPPFSFPGTNGVMMGFDVDIAQALCVQMHKKCSFVVTPFDSLIRDLQLEKYDAIVSSMEITEERKSNMAFSDPYYRVPIFLAGRSGQNIALQADGYVASESLSGLRLGVEQGLHGEAFAAQNFPKAQIKSYAGYEVLAAAVRGGEVDLILDDRQLLQSELADGLGSDYQIYGRGYVGEKVSFNAGVGVRKGDFARLQAINAAIKQIRGDGTFDRIAAKYFSYPAFAE